jgi:hypothetical protein
MLAKIYKIQATRKTKRRVYAEKSVSKISRIQPMDKGIATHVEGHCNPTCFQDFVVKIFDVCLSFKKTF